MASSIVKNSKDVLRDGERLYFFIWEKKMPDNIEVNRVDAGYIEEKLLAVIRNHCLSDAKESISLSSTLESTGIDSLGMAEAAFDLEDIFGFELPDPKSLEGQFGTVRDIYDVIVKYANK